VLWELYKKMTEYRQEMRDDLAVILAGLTEPLRSLLYAVPPLAARFSAVVDFPGYTTDQLAAIFSTLASEAGLSLTQDAQHKAAGVLAQAEAGSPCGNARLAVRLLNLTVAGQARRLMNCPEGQQTEMLRTVTEADIPKHLGREELLNGEDRSGQYL
jgi:stage V sporulation protein K